MNIAVTGGAGFIGSHLVDKLISKGHKVRVIDNLFRGRFENIMSRSDKNLIEIHQLDIRNYPEVQKAFKHCEIVFHLAAQSNVMGAVRDLDYSFSTNVIGTFNVLKACRENGVKRLIFTSSREVYGEALYLPVDEKHPLKAKNSYGASKVAGEAYCRVFQDQSEMDVVILRLSNVYGTRDFGRVIPVFLENVHAGRDIFIYGGEQVIDFISVNRVIAVLLNSMTNTLATSGPINVASGIGTSLFELATMIKSMVTSNSRIVVKPAREIEVVKFTADISLLQRIFETDQFSNPLADIRELL